MIPLVAEKREELRRLCVRYHVRRLDLFGSAARSDFDAERSDLDFVVEFEELKPGQYAQHYFGLLQALQQLFGRSVDLVMLSAVRNPFFREEIESSRMMLYAA